MSVAKVELGRSLFYDSRLSENGSQSCATCHQQARAFTDGKAHGVGSTGQVHPRGPMSLVNVAYASTLTWANPTVTRLEDQALVPMYGTDPIELGLDKSDQWIDRLKSAPEYRSLFSSAFGDASDPVTVLNVTRAIASFERSLISGRSPYDRYHFDRDDSAISPAARRGEVLFFSRPLSCFMCHGGFNFSGAVATEGRRPREVEMHNTGLYNLPGMLSYPSTDTGLFQITQRMNDVGKFKAPTLRNIEVTAPYMHDGSVATLEEALAHYAAGGRTISDGPNRGVGHENPNRSEAIHGFDLSGEQRNDLIAFLKSLTDDAFLTDARFSSPWPTRAQ